MTTEEKYIAIEKAISDAAAEERLAKRELDKLKPEKIKKEAECLEMYGVPVTEIQTKIDSMTAEYETLTNEVFESLEKKAKLNGTED